MSEEDHVPELTIREAAAVMEGRVHNLTGELTFRHYHFDTRLIRDRGTLFFALKSDQSDGHEYITKLKEFPDTAAVVSTDFDAGRSPVPVIRVDDPLKAAHRLARHVRHTCRKTTFVGVTGSAGKTTSKEFLHQLLSTKYRVFRSFENWNNWIGMPFSLLSMEGDEDVAVFELAMSYPGIGEIDCLAEILRPDVAVILNVFPVHLEFLKNLENVARGKAEILNYLEADDVAFVCGDQDVVRREVAGRPGRITFFGRDDQNNQIILRKMDRSGDAIQLEVEFFGLKAGFDTRLINRTHAENLFAALTVAQHIGMKNFEIQEAIRSLKPISGRGEITKKGRLTIIDETYNSNPAALKKTLLWVNDEYESGKIAVIGDMLELGDDEEAFHREVGAFFATLDFDFLIVVGARAAHLADGARQAGYAAGKIKGCRSAEEAGRFLKGIAKENGTILFKASRGIRLESAIEEFCG
jgi:UDP-N-acetylmuramoyl-tripeptide--D-alanyl-D-alanine ligase